MSASQDDFGLGRLEVLVVHHWADGKSACSISAEHGAPVTWPPGNSYSSRWEDVTCQDCRKELSKEEEA